MGVDENTSAVADDVSTSVPAETVESTTTQDAPAAPETPAVDEPRSADDVWDSMDAEEPETQEPEKPEPEAEPEKPSEDAHSSQGFSRLNRASNVRGRMKKPPCIVT